MASGQALLQQMQARRLQVKSSNGNNRTIDIDSGNKRSESTSSAPIRSADRDPSVLPAQVFTTTDAFIEICQGPDCGGLGGGAALLEIEELVCEYEYDNNNNGNNGANKPVLVVGGCRDFCTVGPNVYIGSKTKTNANANANGIHGQQRIHHEHLDHVDNPSRCADVVDALYRVGGGVRATANVVGIGAGVATLPPPTNKESNSLVSRMARRRSERLRWEALRQVSRTSSSAQQQQQQQRQVSRTSSSAQQQEQRRSDGATTTTSSSSTSTTTTTYQDDTPQESSSSASLSSSTSVAVPLQEPALPDTTTTTGVTQTAMNVAVYKSSDAIQELLQAATKAEMNAAGSNLDTRARAQRRSERLFRKMQ